MGGGIIRGAYVALAALSLSLVVDTLAQADGDLIEEDCVRRTPPEQSIVVATGKFNRDELPDVSGDSLEPIAVVSEYVPDLAEPAAGTVPELAKPQPVGEKTATTANDLDSETNQLGEGNPERAQTDVLSFQGITPGISTRINVLRTWGDPRSEETTASELKYRFEKLKNVFVQFDGDVVDAIVVELPKPLPTHKLVSNLGMEKFRPALITDSTGVPQARISPEQGLVLRFADDDQLAVASDMDDPAGEAGFYVDTIVIQPIKADAFLLRAENESSTDLTSSIQDLEQVLRLDHNSAKAKCLLSELSLNTGQAVAAERLAAEAVEIDPANNVYRLQHARCLRQLARYDLAAEEAKKVINSEHAAKLVKAEALYEMGLLASLGSAEVALRAVPLYTKAIKLADELATDEDFRTANGANKLLVAAHLDMALFISKGKFKDKDQAVSQWIERASAISEEMIARDKRHLSLRLQVAVTALAASANLEPSMDPGLWIEEAEQTVAKLREITSDPLLWEDYDWSLGLAFFQAAQIEHRRSKPDNALRLSELAETKLTELAMRRDELPDTSYLMGRLYFQTGAVHAIHFEDHTEACDWYDRAADRLINPVPVTIMAGPQQHGDALVSMGVSYWDQQQQQRAIELTQLGANLIEQAVEKGILDSDSLVVPYGNLAAMYESLGESEPAARYTRLAKQITNTEGAEQRR